MTLNVSAAWRSLRRVSSLIWSDATPFARRRLLVALFFIAGASGLTALAPYFLKLIVDSLERKSQHAISPVFLLAAYVLAQWLARSMTDLRTFAYARAERRMTRTLSERLFSHVIQLPLLFHLDRQTGAISQTLQNGVLGYQMVLNTLVFTILPIIVEAGTMTVVLLNLQHSELLVLVGAAVLAYGSAFARAAVAITGAARKASQLQVDTHAIITDSLINYETIKYFVAEPLIEGRVNSALVGTEEKWIGFHRHYAFNGLRVSAIFAVFLALTMFYAAYEVDGGRMSLGTFVLVNAYLFQIVRPLEMLGYSIQNLSQGIAFLERVLELFQQRPEQSSEPAPGSGSPLACSSGRLSFENVSISYAGRTVLQDVSFEIGPGKTLGVVGGSGAGKSTLIRLLTRMIDTEAGQILLDGAPITSLSPAQLRRLIAVVPQDTVLFNDSIGFNISVGKPGCTEAEMVTAAKVAHLHEFVMTLPNKYETRVGERGVKLSGGEKQRVAIARAALKRPRIFVFDEATSSLDSTTEEDILRSLRDISRSSTTIVIAHRLSTVLHADEIIVLDGGRVVERGTHESLLRAGKRYCSLWVAQHPAERRIELAEIVRG